MPPFPIPYTLASTAWWQVIRMRKVHGGGEGEDIRNQASQPPHTVPSFPKRLPVISSLDFRALNPCDGQVR